MTLVSVALEVKALTQVSLQVLLEPVGKWAKSFTNMVFFSSWPRSEDPPPQEPCPRDSGAGQPFARLASVGGKPTSRSRAGLKDTYVREVYSVSQPLTSRLSRWQAAISLMWTFVYLSAASNIYQQKTLLSRWTKTETWFSFIIP